MGIGYGVFDKVLRLNEVILDFLKESKALFETIQTPNTAGQDLCTLQESLDFKIRVAIKGQTQLNSMLLELYSNKLENIQSEVDIFKDLLTLDDRLDKLSEAMDNNASLDSINEGFLSGNENQERDVEILKILFNPNQ